MSNTLYAFLVANGLEKEVKLNIEANHATLAGPSFEHGNTPCATAVAILDQLT